MPRHTAERRKQAAVAALLCALAAGSPVSAAPSVCVDHHLDTRSWVEKQLASADVVLLGKVVSVEAAGNTPRRAEGEAVGSLAELIELIERGNAADRNTRHPQKVLLEVARTWKGPERQTLTVNNRVVPGRQGFPLEPGESYLIFGYEQPDGDMTISTLCEATLTEAEAGERIRVLNELAGSD